MLGYSFVVRKVAGNLMTKSWELLSDDSKVFDDLPIPTFTDMEGLLIEWAAALEANDPSRDIHRRTWTTFQSIGRSTLIDVTTYPNGIFRFGGGYNDYQRDPPRVTGSESRATHENIPPTDDELRVIWEMRRFYEQTTDDFIDRLDPQSAEVLRQIAAFATMISYPEGAVIEAHKDKSPVKGIVLASFMPHSSTAPKKWVINGTPIEQEPGQFLLLRSGPKKTNDDYLTPKHQAGDSAQSVGYIYAALSDYFGRCLYDSLVKL